MLDLPKYGYAYSGSCQCDGIRTLKYRNGDREIRYRVSRSEYKIKNKGVSVTGWMKEPVAEITINELHNVAIQA